MFKTLWRRSLEGVSMASKRKQEETGWVALGERGKGWAGRLDGRARNVTADVDLRIMSFALMRE